MTALRRRAPAKYTRSATGATLALIAFVVSAVSAPMIFDRQTGTGTAVLTSLKAVAFMRNSLSCAWRLTIGSFAEGLPYRSNFYCLPGRGTSYGGLGSEATKKQTPSQRKPLSKIVDNLLETDTAP